MQKVTNIYFEEVEKNKEGFTGLIIELEDGTQYRQITENVAFAPYTKVERMPNVKVPMDNISKF